MKTHVTPRTRVPKHNEIFPILASIMSRMRSLVSTIAVFGIYVHISLDFSNCHVKFTYKRRLFWLKRSDIEPAWEEPSRRHSDRIAVRRRLGRHSERLLKQGGKDLGCHGNSDAPQSTEQKMEILDAASHSFFYFRRWNVSAPRGIDTHFDVNDPRRLCNTNIRQKKKKELNRSGSGSACSPAGLQVRSP